MLSLSLAQARRVALAAQGFGDPRPAGRVDARHVRRVLTRIGLLQLDSVNVFCRSHYLPVLARLGPYPRELLDELSAHTAGRVRRRELFEYWAHEASLVPVEHQPLLRWRMARAAESAWPGVRRIAREKPHLLEDILAMIEAEGPIRSSQTGIAPIEPRPGHMWNWHDGKIALEYLFYAGRVTAARRVNFERYYDLPERVLPAEVLAAPTPEPADAFRELVRISARAHGVGTEPDLRDYFRLSHNASKRAVAELVESGELLPTQVEGWDAPAYPVARGEAPAPHQRPRAAVTLRPGRLVPRSHRAAVRVPLPHRDLHARPETRLRLLRAAGAARRGARRPGRPQVGPPGRRPAGTGRASGRRT